jgi:cell fate regulator YaaT (PSP1 superfamily)
MPPVSMRMAKIQKTTLDPTKISGRCGRLKCCLRYEYDTYRALEQELPPVGSRVATDRGVGKVIGLEILAGKVVIEFDDRRRASVPADEVLGVEKKGRPRPDDRHEHENEPGHDDHVEDRP